MSKGSNSKNFFYLGQSLLSDGSSQFLQGAGIDQPLQLDTNLGSQSYLQDHLGSISQLVDSLNGNSKARYDYKSYGKLEGDIANSQASNPFTYTGREDDGTGLLYYRARYYDPELEVFISQDPLGDAQRYVGGNPMSAIDPEGTNALLLIHATFAAGGALTGVAAQGVSDLVTGNTPNINDYRAAYVGGAVTGLVLLTDNPFAAGAAGGPATNATRQALNQKGFDAGNFITETLVGAATGRLTGGKVPPFTSGQGNYNAIYKQMMTKIANSQIKNVTTKTATKMFVGKAVSTAFFEGQTAGGIVNTELSNLNKIPTVNILRKGVK